MAAQSQDPPPTGQNQRASKTIVDVNDSNDEPSDIELSKSQGQTDEQELRSPPTGQNQRASKTIVDVNDSNDEPSDIELSKSQGQTDEQEL
ncbi:hypothetical protein H4Q26_016812, partial [Puccinia striiformis f. sp. tritici PST-130]